MPIQLNEKQLQAYEYIKKGENIFITGAGGTGKSEIIKIYYNEYKYSKKIGLTSTTGTSALLINGQTLHSFLGIGLGKSSIDILVRIILGKSLLKKKWENLQTLIIDEVSMLSPDLFDKLEEMSRIIRKNDDPFGGIQLILSGDFLQLDPIGSNDKLCFHSDSWNDCIKNVIYLQENIRQDNKEFQDCLNEVRIANVSEKSKDLLLSCKDRNLDNKYGIKPTKIYAINKKVDYLNTKELNKLPKPYYEYDMDVEIYDKTKAFKIEMYEKRFTGDKVLTLALGAQVMLLYNKDITKQLVNGSRGIVTGFIEDKPIVNFTNGIKSVIDYHNWDIEEDNKIILSFHQIPLKLAYASSIHRNQGQTLDYAEIDLKDVFSYGQVYTALSRVKNHECLSIKNICFLKIIANPYALEYYKSLENNISEEISINNTFQDKEENIYKLIHEKKFKNVIIEMLNSDYITLLSNKKINNIVIYTDGSCIGNPGPGGWAYIKIKNGNIIEENKGNKKYTTNNIMEMTAIIESLKNTNLLYNQIHIFTDSQYVINGITKWIKEWINNNWKTSKKTQVLNKDLWENLYILTNNRNILWHHVKSHTNDKHNDYVDSLAKQMAKDIISQE